MLKCIYLQLISVFLISCNSHLADNDEDILQRSTSSYIEIEFLFDENTYLKDMVKDYPVLIINNNSDVEQSFVDDPQRIFFEKSNFWNSDDRAFSYIDDQKYIKTPLGKSIDQKFIYDDEVRWIYSNVEQKRRPIIIRSFPTVNIKPKHRLLVYPRFKFREIATTYKLYLKGIDKGDVKLSELAMENIDALAGCEVSGWMPGDYRITIYDGCHWSCRSGGVLNCPY